MGDILATVRGKLLFMQLMSKLMPKKKKGDKKGGGFGDFEMNKDAMMQMLGGFTILRLTGMIGMVGVELTKEDLLALNKKLNKVRKPKN